MKQKGVVTGNMIKKEGKSGAVAGVKQESGSGRNLVGMKRERVLGSEPALK